MSTNRRKRPTLAGLRMGLLLVAFLATAIVGSFRYAIARKKLADFFPLLFLVYVLIANISFSMIAETEVFVWLLIVSVIFMLSSFSGAEKEDGHVSALASNPG